MFKKRTVHVFIDHKHYYVAMLYNYSHIWNEIYTNLKNVLFLFIKSDINLNKMILYCLFQRLPEHDLCEYCTSSNRILGSFGWNWVGDCVVAIHCYKIHYYCSIIIETKDEKRIKPNLKYTSISNSGFQPMLLSAKEPQINFCCALVWQIFNL